MTDPVKIIDKFFIVGFSKEAKDDYQRQATLRCLSSSIIFHAPLNEITTRDKKDLIKGLGIKKEFLEEKIESLNNPAFVLIYKN
jgi:hypothetical protein